MMKLSNDIRQVTPDEVRQELQGLPNWLYDEDANALVRQYRFEDGAGADRFLTALERLATEVGYEPAIDREGSAVELCLGRDEPVVYRDLEFAHLLHALDERNA